MSSCLSGLLLGGEETLLSPQATSAAGGNETNLLTGRSVTAHRGRVANVLMVTTTVGMLHGVHSHTTNLGPGVALRLVLVVRDASLQQGLLGTATAGNLANHGAAAGGNDLLGAGGELDAGDVSVGVVGHDDGVVAGGAGEAAAVTHLRLEVADDGTLGHGADGQHVADSEDSLLTAVQELTSVHALRRNEGLLLLSVADGVAEGHPGEGSATAGVVDQLGHQTLDVSIALSVILRAELSSTLAVVSVGPEDGSRALTLCANHASHLVE
mmetsp:Transcript_38741/g.84285  ORF Transcript_38741/g.84285 Transcript_38741/m.84285 type:complete len:269 (+) Transcript_38741:107-913(+)